MAAAVEAALGPRLASQGYAVARHDLPSLPIPDCQGDFGCWTATPGVCVHAGAHRDVARDVIQSDLVVWLTPVTFGGYSSALKRALDHCIPLISPWFMTVEGETHHRPRYERFPDVLVVGLAEKKEEDAVRVFERLVLRNAVNMHTRRFLSVVIDRTEAHEIDGGVGSWLERLAVSGAPHVGGPPLDLSPRADLALERPGSALLLVGSPRGGASVSASLAGYLGRRLAARRILVAAEHVKARDPRLDLGFSGPDGPRQSDLLVLATPLYVDSLPSPVTALLEGLARRKTLAGPRRSRLLAIVNSGFPEAVHNDTALAICKRFAAEAGLDWVGGLGLGGGGMFAGKPLAEQGGRARTVRRALDLTADALSEGRVVPEEARQLMATLPIPRWLYRLFGEWGFRQEARKHGVRARVDARPYAA
jgi:multimeric flavodoxin WrbA